MGGYPYMHLQDIVREHCASVLLLGFLYDSYSIHTNTIFFTM